MCSLPKVIQLPLWRNKSRLVGYGVSISQEGSELSGQAVLDSPWALHATTQHTGNAHLGDPLPWTGWGRSTGKTGHKQVLVHQLGPAIQGAVTQVGTPSPGRQNELPWLGPFMPTHTGHFERLISLFRQPSLCPSPRPNLISLSTPNFASFPSQGHSF